MARNKQDEIVLAATDLFREKGYHGTSMQDIADAVQLQKGSLYHYISSKEDLLMIIVREAVDTYVARLNAIAASDLSPREKFVQAVRQHLMGIANNLGMLTIFLREVHALTPEQRRFVRGETERYNRVIEGIFADGVAQGAFRPLDPRVTCRAVLGSCNWFYRWYRPSGAMSLEALADFYVDVFFKGIES